MQKRTVQRGRPVGSTTYEPEPALAFGQAVRAARMEQGMAQEELAALAEIERSHMGKIERGEHMPTLALILRIAAALNKSAAELIAAVAAQGAERIPGQALRVHAHQHRLLDRREAAAVPHARDAHGQRHVGAAPLQQRIAKEAAQAIERVARRRLRQVQPAGRPGDAALSKQGIEDEQQVQIDGPQIHGMHV